METKLKIRNLHRRGEGIRAISRDLNLSRNTVRSIIRIEGSPAASYERARQPYFALGDYIGTLEKLLRENKTAKPKRNAKHLFEELQNSGYSKSPL